MLRARELKPISVNFVNDFARRTMEKRSAQIQDLIDARRAGKVAYFVNGSRLVVRQPGKYAHWQNNIKQDEKPPDIGKTNSPIDGSSGDDEVIFKDS